MIYTVTLNPSLDYVVGVENFVAGKLNRTTEEVIFPGGKGINVSIVLNNLGVESVPLGFVAGFTGKEIERLLQQKSIKSNFLNVASGNSRINVKLRSLVVSESGTQRVEEETEINGMGPAISDKELERFFAQIECLVEGDIIVLAGSIPSVLPGTIYRDIVEKLASKKVLVVVDATKQLLMNVLEFRPFLVKPNNIELGELFDVKLTTKEEVIFYAKKLQTLGARNVLVSMAGEGAVLVSEDEHIYQAAAPKGNVVNSVGAGDSMVAGFLYGYLSQGSYEQALYYGVCAGSASAFSSELATKEKIELLMKNWKK